MRLHLGCSDDFKLGYTNVDCVPPPARSVDVRTHEDPGAKWMTAGGFLYQRADLNNPWPWEDSSVDEIVANDVFEHLSCLHWGFAEVVASYELPDGSWQTEPITRLLSKRPEHQQHMQRVCIEVPGKTWAMNEAHRVLRPGGMLRFTVPCVHLTDKRLVNSAAFSDPTHRTYWTFDDCFYFGEQWNTPDMERGRLGEAYGITALFRFPQMVDFGAKGWHVVDRVGVPELLKWQVEEANGRAKIRAVLEAVK